MGTKADQHQKTPATGDLADVSSSFEGPLMCKSPTLVHRRSIAPPTSSQGSHQQQEEELKALLRLWQEDRSGQQLRVQVEAALPPAPTGSYSSF